MRFTESFSFGAILAFAASAFVLGLFGRDSHPRAKQDTVMANPKLDGELPEITSETERGLVDLVLRLVEYRVNDDGSQIVKAGGLHKGKPIGFELILEPGWKRGKADNHVPIQIHNGKITYRRLGPESDAFIQALDELYGTKLGPKTMAGATTFTGVSLDGDPGNLGAGPVKIKLFFEGSGEGAYAELFTNIDLGARRIEVREKDEEYRSPVVRALCSQ